MQTAKNKNKLGFYVPYPGISFLAAGAVCPHKESCNNHGSIMNFHVVMELS